MKMPDVDNRDDKAVLQKPPSRHAFRKAFVFGAVWWLVLSLLAVSHNHTWPPGFIFGELLLPSLIAAVAAGTVGRMMRGRAVWPLVITIFCAVWFLVRFAAVVGSMQRP
jgi:hypothetical protein